MSSISESSHTLDSTSTGAIAETLKQLWGSDAAYGGWNDETPAGKKSDSVGHSKGVLAVDSSSGFYLLHSVPRFVDLSASKYGGLPSDEVIYAQSFVCISASSATIDDVAQMLQLNHAQVYFTAGKTSLVNVANFFAGMHSTDPVSKSIDIHTTGGTHFTLFSKTGEWGKDLWADLVAPSIQGDMIAETWIRGDAIGPSCPPTYKYTVLDSQSVTFAGTQWTEEQDHSKWAVQSDGGYASCIGDINRMTSQYSRGGGTLCVYDSGLHKGMYTAIDSKDSCSNNNLSLRH